MEDHKKDVTLMTVQMMDSSDKFQRISFINLGSCSLLRSGSLTGGEILSFNLWDYLDVEIRLGVGNEFFGLVFFLQDYLSLNAFFKIIPKGSNFPD